MFPEKGLKHECGLFGVYGHPDASYLTYLGLYALQHRGQESVGIASSDGLRVHLEKSMGQVAEAFDEEKIARLPGSSAIGHVRYSTAGESSILNAQPLYSSGYRGEIALVHNGNLINVGPIRDELERLGSIFVTTSDSEVILHLIARSKEPDLLSAVIDALSQVKGAYSLLFLTREKLIAVRDPHGFRPLLLGKRDDAFVFASESCAFDLIGAKMIRELEPGEVVVVDPDGLKELHPFPKVSPSFCIFELIYFARPDSYIFEHWVSEVRVRLGRKLARTAPIPADIVVPVPDSGVYAAQGYAKESGIPLEFALIRNHYVGRTFIEPKQKIRHFRVRVKLNPLRSVIKGKRVILVDDSIVRGTTSRKIVTMVRSAGASEVHMRVSSPPIISPCYYGIDTPTRKELIASSHTVEEIRKYLRADSLAYLSLEDMLDAVSENRDKFCTACFTGCYPVPFPRFRNNQLFLFGG
ncbi:MAG: amidophosphoribosyltransferase [Acidobacteria bacterium]|nr:amidophosphoribosyltransferase [Acidobacteriota bacterium]